jgi:hypothetical protein
VLPVAAVIGQYVLMDSNPGHDLRWRYVRDGLFALSVAVVIAAVTLAFVLNQFRTTYEHQQHLNRCVIPGVNCVGAVP